MEKDDVFVPDEESKDLHDLEHEERFGETDQSDLDISETDEDEDEAVGDGNLGKSSSDLFRK